MNKENLIKLGAFAQREFSLDKDFKIIDISTDQTFLGEYHLPIPPTYHGVDYNPFVQIYEQLIDNVTLIKVAIPVKDGNPETVWIGYSRLANTLIYREPGKIHNA